MIQISPSRISSCGSVVRVLRLISVRLPVQIQPVCFCPSASGVSAPALFKSSEAKPAPSSRHGGLPPRDNSFFCQDFKDSTTVYEKWYAENELIQTVKKNYLTSSQQLTSLRDHFNWLCKGAMLQLQANRHLTFFSLNSGKAHRFHTVFG